MYYVVFLGEFAEASGRAGDVAEGLVAIDEGSSAPNATRSDGTFRNFCESRGDLARREGTPRSADEAEKWLRHRSTWLESKRRDLGNCEPPRAFAACGVSRVAQARRMPNSRRFSIDSKKDLEPRTCARPKSFSAASHDLLQHHSGLFLHRNLPRLTAANSVKSALSTRLSA